MDQERGTDPPSLIAQPGALSAELLAAGAEPVAQQEQSATALLDLCYEISKAMNRQATLSDLGQLIAQVSADLVVADAAAVAVSQGAKDVSIEATSEAALAATKLQFVVCEGPAYEAMTQGEARTCDAHACERCPAHAAHLEGLSWRHELALPLHCRNVRATVSVFSTADAPFPPAARKSLALLVRHAGTVLAQADVEANLRVAVESRQQVGQAVGILVERHRITAEAAFRRLVRASNITQTKLRDLAALLIETGMEPPEK